LRGWWVVPVVGVVAYLGFSSYVANTAVNVPRLPITGSPDDVGLDYEDVSFLSRNDSIELKGWYIESGEPCIIIVNGGHQTRNDEVTGTLQLTRDLVGQGFSVLLFDWRGRGESEGKGKTLTHNDRDIGGAVDYLRSRGYSRISAIGFSTGGAALSMFVDGFEVLVLDSCFTNVQDLFLSQVVSRDYPEWFARFISPGTFLMAKLLYGFNAVSPEDKIGDISCPILFIHGENDEGIPLSNSQKLYDARGNPQDSLWIVPNADHTQSYKADPVEYVRKVTDYIETPTGKR
jgi:fermentation-respiration switch protein FrsA (DUF1100 family)